MEKLEAIIKKYTVSSCLTEAILADYVKVISSLTNEDSNVIRERIINDTNARLQQLKDELGGNPASEN